MRYRKCLYVLLITLLLPLIAFAGEKDNVKVTVYGAENAYTVVLPAVIELKENTTNPDYNMSAEYQIEVKGNIDRGRYVVCKPNPNNDFLLEDAMGERYIYPVVDQPDTIWLSSDLSGVYESRIKAGTIYADVPYAGKYSGELGFEYYLDGKSLEDGSILGFQNDEIAKITVSQIEDAYVNGYNLPKSLGIEPGNIGAIKIPEGTQKIGEYAFSNCVALKEVYIPDSVEVIEEGAFLSCPSLLEIHLPDVRSIEDKAFYGCVSLNSAYLLGDINHLGSSVFEQCTSLQRVVLSDEIKTISPRIFYNCMSLKSIVLPENLETIEEYAFYNCSCLPFISIPESIYKIGGHAFESCWSLNSVYFSDVNGWNADGIPIDKNSLYDSYNASNLLKFSYPDRTWYHL